MKFMLVIPVELDVKTTKRQEHRDAAERKMIELARNGASEFLRNIANKGDFLVRSWEKTPAVAREAKATPSTANTENNPG